MYFQYYLEKLESYETYLNFIKENSSAYLYAGFFVFDYPTNREEQKLDFFDPLTNKTITFDLFDEELRPFYSQTANNTVPEKIPHESNVNVNELKEIIEKKLKDEKVNGKIIKLIAVFHKYKDNLIWNIQVVLSTFDIMKIHINDDNKEIILFEKHNLMEFIKRVE